MPQNSQMIEYFGLFRSDFIDPMHKWMFEQCSSNCHCQCQCRRKTPSDYAMPENIQTKKKPGPNEGRVKKKRPNISNKNHNKWLSKFIQCCCFLCVCKRYLCEAMWYTGPHNTIHQFAFFIKININIILWSIGSASAVDAGAVFVMPVMWMWSELYALHSCTRQTYVLVHTIHTHTQQISFKCII